MSFLWTKRVKLIELFVLSVLTVLGIGSQFFSNLAYSLNQGLLQTAFGLGSKQLIIPSIIGNFSFALGIPLGHVFTHKLGTKKTFIFFTSCFLVGSIIGIVSFDIYSLSISKTIQGFSTGILFFTLLPKLFQAFPKRYKNVFLLLVIVGLFGANALGGISGSYSLELDRWKWIFVINIVSSILCLILGPRFLNNADKAPEKEEKGIPWHIVFLVLTTITISVPMIMLTQQSHITFLSYIFLLIAVLFFVNFVYFNMKSDAPIMYFSTLFKKKPIVGSVMAISSHLTLLVGIAGINVFLLKALKLPFEVTEKFYLYFFIGVIVTGFIKMLFYSSIGAGILGTVGATSLMYVSIHWIVLEHSVNVNLLYLHGFLLGFGTSMTLLSGAMATLLDGDLKYASNRSVTMHSIRNFLSALLVPIVTYILKDDIQKGLQTLYSGYTTHIANKFVLTQKIQDVIIHSNQKIFTLMLIFNVVMLISSIIQIFLGKGRRITPKS